MMIRDIHQLREAPPYGIVAVEGLATAEAAFQTAAKYVPYCPEHLDVWSPQFAQIILECASQVDSLWKAVEKTENPSSSTDKLTIKNHWDRYRDSVSPQKVIFFGGPNPAVISPFDVWSDTTFQSPDWWQAYNKLKHDRFTYQAEATMSNALRSIAGLFLAIVYCGVCDLALISAQMLDTSKHGYNPWAFTKSGFLRDVPFMCRTIIDTRLFAHPLGVFGVSECTLSNWWDSHSPRFNIWWALNAVKYTVGVTGK
ncbi:hypothetical protein [Rubinisphaera margarita]|uniref:hypothetical protein n=1 Tax=Rubinisphaera margarita TaxID=2909586 RepID=UPI001EE83069|nr:hypothetical protein [Rubinisphaera margarita]MCG6157080.1 hypothetical protein [Rubinisphaera margarita]